MIDINEQIAAFFKDDIKKVDKWMNTQNPSIGYLTPNEMINLGGKKRVEQVVDNMLKGELP